MEFISEVFGPFLYLTIFVFYILGVIYLFKKAGVAGWKAIIPYYNLICLCRIAKLSGWFSVLYLIPLVNLVAFAYVQLRIATQFKLGKLGLFFLCFIPTTFFATIYLGFSGNKYNRNNVEASKSDVVVATLAILFALLLGGLSDLAEESSETNIKIEFGADGDL